MISIKYRLNPDQAAGQFDECSTTRSMSFVGFDFVCFFLGGEGVAVIGRCVIEGVAAASSSKQQQQKLRGGGGGVGTNEQTNKQTNE